MTVDREIRDSEAQELVLRVAVETKRRLVHGDRDQRLDIEHEQGQGARFEEQPVSLLGLAKRLIRAHRGGAGGALRRIRPCIGDRERRVGGHVLEEAKIPLVEWTSGIAAREAHDPDHVTPRQQRRDDEARDVLPLDQRPPLRIESREQSRRVDHGNEDRLACLGHASRDSLADALGVHCGGFLRQRDECGIGVVNRVGQLEDQPVGAHEANDAEVAEGLAEPPGHERQQGFVIIRRRRELTCELRKEAQTLRHESLGTARCAPTRSDSSDPNRRPPKGIMSRPPTTPRPPSSSAFRLSQGHASLSTR